MKICAKCKNPKHESEFSTYRSQRTGRNLLRSLCKPCERLALKEWRKQNPEKRRLQAYKWRDENPIKAKEIAKRSFIKSRHLSREREFKKKYGISLQDAENILSDQGNICKICRKPLSKMGFESNNGGLDHCHSTLQIRGILCRHCNVAIGAMMDNPEIAKACAEYLSIKDYNLPRLTTGTIFKTKNFLSTGPIACRGESCDGICGLKSIYAYGEQAILRPLPTDANVRRFATRHGLNSERCVACCNPSIVRAVA